MKYFKRFRFILYFMVYLLLLAFLLTIFNLIIGFNNKTNELITLISVCSYGVFFGIRNALKVSNNVLVSGLKYGFIHVIILYVISIIVCGFHFSLQQFLYYLIILAMFLFGTMFGIKIKKE